MLCILGFLFGRLYEAKQRRMRERRQNKGLVMGTEESYSSQVSRMLRQALTLIRNLALSSGDPKLTQAQRTEIIKAIEEIAQGSHELLAGDAKLPLSLVYAHSKIEDAKRRVQDSCGDAWCASDAFWRDTPYPAVDLCRAGADALRTSADGCTHAAGGVPPP